MTNMMYTYIKIEGHSNWFLVVNQNTKLINQFSENMQEKMIRSVACEINQTDHKGDWERRITMVSTMELDYHKLSNKYGTIIVRPNGTYMLLKGNNVIYSKIDTDFPIDQYADIVICENDKNAEVEWINYLVNRYPNKTIATISFFDLQSEEVIEKWFKNCEIISFSTTFSDFKWFKTMTKLSINKKVIGYCHDQSKWSDALKINSNVEIVKTITKNIC